MKVMVLLFLLTLAKKVVEDIKKFGLVQRGFLGVGKFRPYLDEDQAAGLSMQATKLTLKLVAEL